MAGQANLEQSYFALFKFLILSKKLLYALGAEAGLTGMQTMTLLLLEEPCPMNSFKKLFNCDASNITGIIDGLEQKKLVKRFENKEDRRIKMLELKPKGVQVRSDLFARLISQHTPLLSKLTPEELETFTKLLGKITQGERVAS